jgi:hypothetical protein
VRIVCEKQRRKVAIMTCKFFLGAFVREAGIEEGRKTTRGRVVFTLYKERHESRGNTDTDR